MIRRDVLNMPLKMWKKLPDGDVISLSAGDFLRDIGLPGGLSALFNDEERLFFAEIYKLSCKIRSETE